MVAPLVGAWIETIWCVKADENTLSHPSWVRGLKHPLIENRQKLTKSHPSWVRGLKLLILLALRKFSLSHPSWVRGLKQSTLDLNLYTAESHPSWVRGLKLDSRNVITFIRYIVAPLVGAWIETVALPNVYDFYGRTPRGCVD